MGRNTHPAHANGEFHNRDIASSPTEPGDGSNSPAQSSLVLGIVAVVIQLLGWGVWFVEVQRSNGHGTSACGLQDSIQGSVPRGS